MKIYLIDDQIKIYLISNSKNNKSRKNLIKKVNYESNLSPNKAKIPFTLKVQLKSNPSNNLTLAFIFIKISPSNNNK